MDNLIYVCVESTQRKDFIKLLRGNGYEDVSVSYSRSDNMLLVDNKHKQFIRLHDFTGSCSDISSEDFTDLFL